MSPVLEPIIATEGAKRLEFKYDYIGRRVSKKVWTRIGGSWVDEQTTAFVYDGWNLIEEVTASSATASVNHYTWGIDLSGSLQGAGGVGGLLSHIHTDSSGSSQTFHYTYDLNGNVSEVLDGSGGVAAQYEYGPFGETLVEYNSTGLGPGDWAFRFSTKYFDVELKTYYYGYRYYDPATGRWLNRDPIEESGGLNLYGFVGNDGVNMWDLLGMIAHNNLSSLQHFFDPHEIYSAMKMQDEHMIYTVGDPILMSLQVGSNTVCEEECTSAAWYGEIEYEGSAAFYSWARFVGIVKCRSYENVFAIITGRLEGVGYGFSLSLIGKGKVHFSNAKMRSDLVGKSVKISHSEVSVGVGPLNLFGFGFNTTRSGDSGLFFGRILSGFGFSPVSTHHDPDGKRKVNKGLGIGTFTLGGKVDYAS